MTNRKIKKAGSSQCDRIRRALEAQQGLWVPMPLLAAESGAYAVHSRVSDLRKRGFTIEHKSTRFGSQVQSSYRIP